MHTEENLSDAPSDALVAGDREELALFGTNKRRASKKTRRSQEEIWKERCRPETVARQKAVGCFCGSNCIKNMPSQRVLECRTLNAQRSAAEVRAEAIRVLSQFHWGFFDFMIYSTVDGVRCCRAAFAIEQGFESSYIHRLLDAVKRANGKYSNIAACILRLL